MEPDHELDRIRSNLKVILEQLAVGLQADVATLLLYDLDTDEFDFPVEYGLRDKSTFMDPHMRPRTPRRSWRDR